MELKALTEDLKAELIGDESLKISALCSHSKEVVENSLFIVKKGAVSDGLNFIKEALDQGAVALACQQFIPSYAHITQLVASDINQLEAELASRFYQAPSKQMQVIGITGTNGKTTSAYLIRQLLGANNCGLIGTIEYLVGENQFDACLTTPGIILNQQLLASMYKIGQKHAVMEVTSIALDQNRVQNIHFEVALFTNLSQDHLDYHSSMQSYIDCKAKLFQSLSSNQVAIVNKDDPVHLKLLKNCPAKVMTFAIENPADFRAENIQCDATETHFDLLWNGQRFSVQTPLRGRYNVYNLLGAMASALALGYSLPQLIETAKVLHSPQGRLESIPNHLGIQIFVDFAHTEDALKNVLLTLKDLRPKRLITVFGCGGNRDASKRPQMGRIVSMLSDLTLITSDNPRFEDPDSICQEVLSLAPFAKVIVDRREAIQAALLEAEKGDIILIAGRGHEKYQIIKGQKIPFQDAKVAKELVKLMEQKVLL